MKKKTVMSYSDLSSFSYQLATLIKSGISPSDAVGLIEPGEVLTQKVLEDIAELIYTGGSLHTALTGSGIFPERYLAVVNTGEVTGRSEESFFALASYYERQDELNKSAASAMRYPMILFFAFAAVAMVVLAYVVPVFAQVYDTLGATKNTIFAALYTLGRFIRSNLLICSVLLGVGAMAAGRFFSAKRKASSGYVTGGARLRYLEALSDYASDMTLCLKSGFTIAQAADFALGNTVNFELKAKLASVESAVDSGLPLAEGYKKGEIFDPQSCGIISVGIKTGKTEDCFALVAQRCAEQSSEAAAEKTEKQEPIMVLLLSVFIAAIMFAVMLPLINIMTSL